MSATEMVTERGHTTTALQSSLISVPSAVTRRPPPFRGQRGVVRRGARRSAEFARASGGGVPRESRRVSVFVRPLAAEDELLCYRIPHCLLRSYNHRRPRGLS